MNYLFKESEYNDALATKRKLKRQAILLAALCLCLNAVIIVLKFLVPWGQSTFWYQFANCVVTIAYAFWLVYFFGVPYRLTNEYISLFRSVVKGSALTEDVIFLGMREDLIEKNGIRFYELLFYAGLDKKGNDKISKGMLEEEREIPELEIGDRVMIEVCSNVLRGYELIERGARSEAEVEEIMQRLSDSLGLITTDAE